MSALVLKLTDGTTTLDLNDMTNYGIPDQVWSPAMATRRISKMGGLGAYHDVIENIPVHVRGATAAAALDNVLALIALLDQAQLWADGGLVDPVTLQYTPINSSMTNPVEAIVLGPGGDNNMLRLPPQINAAGNYEIPGVNLSIRRRGLWSGAEEGQTPPADTHPSLTTITMVNDLDHSTPTDVRITFSAGTVASSLSSGVLALTSIEDGIYFGEAENLTAGAGSSITNVLDADASESYYSQLSKSDDSVNIYYKNAITINSKARRFAIYALMHNPHTAAFQIKAVFGGSTPYISIEPTTQPRVMLIGVISTTTTPSTLLFYTLAPTLTSNALQMDYYFIVALSPHTTVLSLPEFSVNPPSNDEITIEHNYNTELYPTVSVPFSGNPMWNTRGTKLKVLLAANNDDWGLHLSGGTKFSTRVLIGRHKGYLTPD